MVAFASAVLPFVNIEAYLAAVGAAVEDVGVWVMAAAAAVGQTAGKVAIYYAADWAMNLPWIRRKMATPKWQASYDRWQRRVDEHPGQTGALLFASASLGFPPLYVMAVLAGQLKVNIWLFVSTCLVGRYLRFLAMLGGANWLVGFFRMRGRSAVLEPHQAGHGRHVGRTVGAEVDRGVVVVPLDAVAGALAPLGLAGADVDGGEVPAVVERAWTPSWCRRTAAVAQRGLRDRGRRGDAAGPRDVAALRAR